jgi:hypothetical protein
LIHNKKGLIKEMAKRDLLYIAWDIRRVHASWWKDASGLIAN